MLFWILLLAYLQLVELNLQHTQRNCLGEIIFLRTDVRQSNLGSRMTGKESQRDSVISVLRSCLLSVKGGIPITNLERDYKILEGCKIPYQRLGYHTLEQFLKSIPDVSISRGRNGEMMLDAIPNKNTEHLASLVAKQKSNPKKLRPPLRSIHPPRRTAASSWRPPPSASFQRTSRRSPPAGYRAPLSVTLNNETDAKGRSSEKPRQVSFAPKPSSEPWSPPPQNRVQFTHSSSSGGGKSYHTFEKPPRFLRLSQPEIVAPASFPEAICPPFLTPEPAQVLAPVSAFGTVPIPPATSLNIPMASRAQERLQQAVSNKKETQTVSTTEDKTNRGSDNSQEISNIGSRSSNEVSSIGSRTIISPLTPLQARLNVGPRKHLQVQIVNPLDEQLAGVSLNGGENFMKALEEHVASKGMSKPSYRVLPRMSGNDVFYSGFVKIDEFSISSYPDERSSPKEAMQVVAKQALDELMKLSPVVGVSTTQNKDMIMTRIVNIVAEHRAGIWSTQIPIDYNQIFNETLPDDWLKIMERCPLVTLERVAGSRIIITPNSPTLSVKPVNLVNPTPPSFSMDTPHVRPLLSPIGTSVPEPINLPQDDVWDVYITCGSSTDEIWFRLIGEAYSVRYENMVTDMEMFYMGKEIVAPNPEVGCIYALKVDDCWNRVELVEIKETGTEGQVFFMDYGDEEEVQLDQLHILERRFARLPAQAIRCYLSGLEDFAEDQNAGCHITDQLIGKTLVAEIKSRPSAENPGIGVVLYDTSTDEDLNVNMLLMENISRDALAPQLPMEGQLREVYISHVTDKGDVFLQFDSYNYLQSLVSNLVESGMKEELIKNSNNPSLDPRKLYLARYHVDGNWYRAAIRTKLDGQKQVEAFFVDFGNMEVINPSDLILLETLKRSVAEFPYQAVKVHLSDVPPSTFSRKVALRVRELVTPDERVLVKTKTTRTSDNIPLVEIFKRIQPDNLLVSINDTLAYDLKESNKSSPEDINNLRGKKRLERLQSLTSTGVDDSVGSSLNNNSVNFDSQYDPTLKGLFPPQIPEIGDYFDVHVTMAANPGNFTVQPYKDAIRLGQMMESMQSQYKQNKFPHPSPESVREGGLYAALHHDANWYRVCVSNVINGNMVSVYFCDYGDVSVLSLEKLQPLTSQFKELPYQAIKAKLAGVQPKHSDWSVEDCLMFQELVVEHQFVSIIMETGPDLLNPSDTVIGLKLIDTAGEEDVYIDRLLVEQDRAIAT